MGEDNSQRHGTESHQLMSRLPTNEASFTWSARAHGTPHQIQHKLPLLGKKEQFTILKENIFNSANRKKLTTKEMNR